MTRRFGLVLGACAIAVAVSPAFALEPPAKVHLFHYAEAEMLQAYVDFNSLDRSDPMMPSGWTYSVYTPPKPIDGLEKPIGSYWEKFDADCGTYSIVSYGIVGLTPDDAVIYVSRDDEAPTRRDAAPGTVEESLLKLICSGTTPTGTYGFASAEEAERAVRVSAEMDRAMDSVEDQFGIFGDFQGGGDTDNTDVAPAK